jgi:hypothetical protein
MQAPIVPGTRALSPKHAEIAGKYGKNMSCAGHCAQMSKDVWRKWGKGERYFVQG